jgi:DNA-binding NarL/FixJ family response regulator
MKILIADDHALFREGIAFILRADDETISIVETSNFDEALAALDASPDIELVLIDLYMPGRNGFEALQDLTRLHPTLPVVVLSGSNNQQDMHRAIRLGAMGYICKESGGKILLNALQVILAGEVYLPSQLLRSGGDATKLTHRQIDVLEAMEEGLSNKLIASRLSISEPTVKMHITAIFRELKVTNRTQAVIKARELQILNAG